MKTPNILFWAGIAILVATGRGLGSPPDVAIWAVGEDRESSQITFDVATEAPEISGNMIRAEVRLKGFDGREPRVGAPDLPTRTVLVAIPPGATPRLEMAEFSDEVLSGIIPRPVRIDRPEIQEDVPIDDSTERLARAPSHPATLRSRLAEEAPGDASIYGGTTTWPAQVAWLGEVGVLRDQRYVEVQLAPVRFDPSIGGLRVTRSIRVTVHFDGEDGERNASRTDAVFENVYRKAFVNYAQGTAFRLPQQATSVPSFAPATTLVGPRYRLKIRQNRVVRLDFATISTTPFATVPLAQWKLTSRGVEVPLESNDDGDGLLEAGEWVQFWGQALDDEPDTVLNTDIPGTEDDIFEARDFSDENVYFLLQEAGARARISQVDAAPTNNRVPPVDFISVAHAEVDNLYRPLGGADPWYWGPSLCNNANCGTSLASRTDVIALPGLRSPTLPIEVTARLRGLSADDAVLPDHKSRVTLLNGSNQSLAEKVDNNTFDGRTLYTEDFIWNYSAGGFQASDPVRVKTELLVSGTVNQAALDWIDVSYHRSFTVNGDVLAFDWPDGNAEFIIDGLTDPSPVVYEISAFVAGSGIRNPRRLLNATTSPVGPYSIRFRVDNDPAVADGTKRYFVVTGAGAAHLPAPADFAVDTVSDLRNTTIQADLIVLAHPGVLDTAPLSPLTKLLDLRQSQGISSKIVSIDDVYDEFNDGLAGPVAIKKFLQWVLSNQPSEGWAAPKPYAVLLLGDGSSDYKRGASSGNLVPTQIMFQNAVEIGYYASDSLMAAVAGNDRVADLVVGRIPARTASEANTILQKTYDHGFNPPPGLWRRNALLISDRGKQYSTAEAASFEAANDAAITFMKRPPHTARHLRYWSDPAYCNSDPANCPNPAADYMTADILSAVKGPDGSSEGAAIVQYVGHGNIANWSDDAFWNDAFTPRDSDLLDNGQKLPWLLVHNCLTGAFHTTGFYSIGEDWLRRSSAGAVAVFSPSGLSYTYVGEAAIAEIWDDIYGKTKERSVAVPVMDTEWRLCTSPGATTACQSYVFLGDPTLQLVVPSVPPPGIPSATGGNMRVDLSWSPSSLPGAKYDVYRASTLVNPVYTPLNGTTPVTGTTYADLTAVNPNTYYYYVVALDPELFESRWSNYNSDCAVNGPDCVRATAINPNPPAPPVWVTLSDSETGGRLTASWSASPDPAQLKNYTVHIRTASGPYFASYNAAKATTYSFVGLVDGTRYYVAVTETNTSNLTSAFSPEADGVPTFVQGLKSPGFIKTLRVRRDVSDAVLTWGAVTSDIYGKPESVSIYEVYRGTTPNFVPSPANRIGTSATPAYRDAGAIASPARYHYLVRALDTSGNAGGLGNQLPNGIGSLRLARSATPGNVVLSWSAVTTDFDGSPTRIAAYNIYVSLAPFTRANVRDGIVAVSASTAGTSFEFTPPAANQYYSVLAVDQKGNLSPF